LELGEERPFNIQLSGGEPTVRQDLPEIIAMGRAKGFDYIQLNTNGKRLAQEEGYGKILKKAGVSVAFLQFDGTEDRI
ncbi:MAG: radical SAM protein, partial [Anaerovorax sp.]